MVTSSKKAKDDEKKQDQKPKKLPRHIAVMRLSAMGDVAMMAHTLRAFVEAYSDVRVTVVTRKLFVPFFEGLGVEVLEVDTTKGLRACGVCLVILGVVVRLTPLPICIPVCARG